ncbi:MAG TPA: tryptophan synthase subunit alpha [Candidatus Bathyarchaeia archaeon]|nr:tryptophan synthase subunit alpha [Candidatus Bathyarchaeia archaeon]
MSRIKDKFIELASKKQKGLIAYIMTGYPNDKSTMETIRGLVNGGADIIELGLPFSDPLADGPVIQNASFQSLKKGMNFTRFLSLVKKIRKETDIPLVLMTYSNLPYARGYSKFLSEVKKAGIDGIILPDMAIEESRDYLNEIHKNNLDAIFLISPNTSKARIEKISKASSGFLYLVSVFGTTGAQVQFQKYTSDAIRNAKKIVGNKVPLAVGFGVSNPDQAKVILRNGADAIIVGSAFLRLIEKTAPQQIESKVTAFTKSLKKATV